MTNMRTKNCGSKEHPRTRARSAGTCCRCDNRIEVGASIALYDDAWSHTACAGVRRRNAYTTEELRELHDRMPPSPLFAALKQRQLQPKQDVGWSRKEAPRHQSV